ncbi:MAG: oligosaccharide flippase family protein [Bacteroidetes bacterium]|nr:oligosaccharide flippase family protein [Bacteroidota bacterium]
MKVDLKSFLKSASIYTAANFINAAIPFFLLPVLTRFLSTSDYGVLAMFQLLISATFPFMGLNSTTALSRQYFEKDKIDFPAYVTNCIFILFGSTAVVILIFWIFSNPIASFTEFPVQWLWAVVLFAFAQKLTEYILELWRVQQKTVRFGVFRMIRTSLDLGLSLFFIIILKNTWEGRIEGQLYAVVFFGLITFFYLFREKWIKFKWNAGYIKHALIYGAPLIPHVLGGIIIHMSDRIFIAKMVGISEVGLYSVGFQVGMLIALLQNSFNQAWSPWLFGKLKENDDDVKKSIVKITYGYIGIILILALGLSLMAPTFFDLFIGKEFSGARVFVTLIAFGFAFNGMYKMFVNYLFYIQKTYIIGLLTLLITVLNLVLNYILIGRNGAVGAAQATTISYAAQFILAWLICARVYSMPWFNFLDKTKKK